MKTRSTLNDIKLSEYINKKSKNHEPIPFITQVARETGVSAATISRYSKNNGYYSFSELRARFNKKNHDISNVDDHGLLEWLEKRNTEKIAIVTSKSTYLLSYLIEGRLKELGYDIEIVRDNPEDKVIQLMEDDTKILFVSLTGESLRVRRSIAHADDAYLVCGTKKIKTSEEQHIEHHHLDELHLSATNNFERHKSIRSLYCWFDDVFNVLQEKKNKISY